MIGSYVGAIDPYQSSCRATRVHRWVMFQTNPHCHWCGVETRWIPRAGTDLPAPADAATLDHLRYKKPQAFVLACYACNQLRQLRGAGQHSNATPRLLRTLRVAEDAFQQRRVLTA